MREHMKSTEEIKKKLEKMYKWGRGRDSNPSPGIHSPGG